MSKQSIQLVAAQILRDVVDRGRSLDKALSSQSERAGMEMLPELREISYGACRHYFYLNQEISTLISKPIRAKDRIVHFLLMVGMYQLHFMRTPDHAAVNQTVKALAASRQSWAKGLVNAVLREFIRRQEKRDAPEQIETNDNPKNGLSEYLSTIITQAWPDQAESIARASLARPPMTLRVNAQKTTREDYLRLLESHDIAATRTEDSVLGLTLESPMRVERLPMFKEGWVSVQDESAQLCANYMALQGGHRVLDGCAAPGGKTCAMLEHEPGITLTAVDLPERIESVQENLSRIAASATVHDSGLFGVDEWWDGERWDRILLDVPCSGTGVIRRHPDILHHRQDGDIERFAGQQFDMLETAWDILAPGGKILYATCSVAPQENDDVIRRFTSQTSNVAVDALAEHGGIRTEYGIQRLQGLHHGDGFYYCRLTKL